MEESVSGFKIRGDWGEIVEHGERISHALREVDADHKYRDAFAEWDDWRPKAHEQLDDDISEKTAEQAHTDEGPGEQAGKDPEEDIRTAGEKLSESLDEDPDAAVDRWSESIGYVTRAADSASRKAIRTVEDAVYKRVMTRMAPYYFDNDLISANLQQDDTEFAFEVNINDDEIKAAVASILEEYNTEISRWHVDTEKDTAQVEASEGVSVPESDSQPDDSKFSLDSTQ